MQPPLQNRLFHKLASYFVCVCGYLCVCMCGLVDARKIPTRRASYCFATSVSIVIVSWGKTGENSGETPMGKIWEQRLQLQHFDGNDFTSVHFVAFVAAVAAVLKQFNFDLSAKLNVRLFWNFIPTLLLWNVRNLCACCCNNGNRTNSIDFANDVIKRIWQTLRIRNVLRLPAALYF